MVPAGIHSKGEGITGFVSVTGSTLPSQGGQHPVRLVHIGQDGRLVHIGQDVGVCDRVFWMSDGSLKMGEDGLVRYKLRDIFWQDETGAYT